MPTATDATPAIDPDIFRPTELRIDPDSMTFELWDRLGESIQRLRGWQWWWGDWWNYGDRFGDTKYQALADAGIAYRSATQYGWVANAIDPALRRDDLEWSYHRASAGLPPELIGQALGHAAKMLETADGWSYRRHVQFVRELVDGHEGRDPTAPEEDDDSDRDSGDSGDSGERTDPSRRAEFKLSLFVDRDDEQIGLGIVGQLEVHAQTYIQAAGLEHARVSIVHR